jgi:hypothetical protein
VDHFAGTGGLTVPTGAYIGATPPGSVPAPLWWDSNSGQLFIQYNDGSSTQWVSASSLDMSMVAGSFLPLTGGEVSGQIDAATFTTYNHRMQTGGTLNTALGIYGELSGVRTGGNQYFTGIKIISDTMDAGGAGLTGLAVILDGGTTSGAMGGRGAIGAQINFTGAPGNKAAGTGDQFIGVSSYCIASGSVGGAAGSGGPWGSMWGAIAATQLEAGATNWNAAIGIEINTGVAAGASAAYVVGASIVLGTHNQGPQEYDMLLGFGMLNRAGNVGLKNGICFGGPGGWWPIHPSGSLMTTKESFLSSPAYTATHGIDLTGVTFSGTAFRSTGFSVTGSGHLALNAGADFGSTQVGSMTDLSKHIDLYGGAVGIAFSTASIMSFVTSGGGAFVYLIGGAAVAGIGAAGISVASNKVIGAQIAGWGTPTGGARTASFNGASATLPQTSAVLAQLILDLKTHGMLGA